MQLYLHALCNIPLLKEFDGVEVQMEIFRRLRTFPSCYTLNRPYCLYFLVV